ncbi:hypothetical protein R1sor_004748 [Riccia sorocarpa]|uniref:Endonuclease/exonuclease/phosphatase domain-containing protein n=1 Tax=Riccia sorocarpa TaxID=122646 RepID=A0ABD3HHU7_9MARC
MEVVSWNVFGLGGQKRMERVKKWLRTHGREVGVLCLQQLRIKEDLTRRRLTELSEGSQFVVDYTTEGKAGAAVLILKQHWSILESGTKGDGSVAWAKINTKDGIVGVASIHGPRTRTERTYVWEWLKEQWDQGVWIFCGDWNSVETPEDSLGDSPVQLGGERRRWQNLITHHDLEDSWLIASLREGPHFTRQQKVNNRLDQSRLDRIYFSQSEVWNGRIIKVTHDSRGRLSDHRPVHLCIHHRNTGSGRKGTYFKFSAELTKESEVKEKMAQLWREGGDPQEDPRKNWDWRWANAKKILIQVEKERREERKRANEKLEELNRTRIRKEELSAQDKIALESVLQGINKKVSREQNRELIKTPSDVEIQELIESLPGGKSPGLDGMTVEALLELGENAEQDVKDFIWEFWKDRRLT